MAKMLKKDLQAAMQPLRRATERVALASCHGEKPHPADLAVFTGGIDFHGFTVRAELVSKSRVSCGVPAPYHIYQIHYGATHPVHGQVAKGWEAGSFRDVFMRQAKKLSAAPEACDSEEADWYEELGRGYANDRI